MAYIVVHIYYMHVLSSEINGWNGEWCVFCWSSRADSTNGKYVTFALCLRELACARASAQARSAMLHILHRSLRAALSSGLTIRCIATTLHARRLEFHSCCEPHEDKNRNTAATTQPQPQGSRLVRLEADGCTTVISTARKK